MRVFYNEGFKRQKKAFQSNADLVPNTIKYFSSTKLIDRIKARECELCGKTNTPIEIHHVHRLKDLQNFLGSSYDSEKSQNNSFV